MGAKKIIIANWKMHPDTLGQAEEILAKLEEGIAALPEHDFNMVICPPFVFLEDIARRLDEGVLKDVAVLGAQDVALSETLSQTGEISAGQLAKIGVRYVIVGHSDRRWKLGESDEIVNSKIKTALTEGLTPVVCLGERQRIDDWQNELSQQTLATFKGLSAGQLEACLIAYEPVWAISTTPGAKPDTPASAVQSMSLIKDTLSDNFGVSQSVFLYGGSITPDNAHDFLERPEIRGLLVGAASLHSNEFIEILSIASQMI